LNDAAVGLYQEPSGRPLTLSSYFNRTYLRNPPETAAAANLDQQTASAIVLIYGARYRRPKIIPFRRSRL
jgi:hypothetical protein